MQQPGSKTGESFEGVTHCGLGTQQCRALITLDGGPGSPQAHARLRAGSHRTVQRQKKRRGEQHIRGEYVCWCSEGRNRAGCHESCQGRNRSLMEPKPSVGGRGKKSRFAFLPFASTENLLCIGLFLLKNQHS